MTVPRDRIVLTGCAVVALSLVGYGAYAVVTFPAARFGLAGLLAAIPVAILVQRWNLRRAAREFRQAYGPRDLLVVYSASPHWQAYIEHQWIGRWADRVVALNRSAPDWTSRPEAELWRRMAGNRDHTPVVIVVPPAGRPTIFRFYQAFRDQKHGKPSALLTLEEALHHALLPVSPSTPKQR